jgi:propionyl-CoA carboxylase alpha chain
VKLKGWAVESRVYAEDPYRNFLPSTGRLIKYRPPKESSTDGITVRNDTGVFEGGEISIYYDPMIAKLCIHGPDRATAVAAMSAALDEFYVDGIQHNIPLLASIMENKRWKSGHLSTGFIAEEFPQGFAGNELTQSLKVTLSAVAVAADNVENRRKRRIGGQINGKAVSLNPERVVRLGNDWMPVTVMSADEKIVTLDNGKECFVRSTWTPGNPIWRGEIDGKPVSVLVRRILNGYRLSHKGVTADAYVFNGKEAELARLMPVKKPADTSKKLLCPMPGLIVSIAVAEGQEVKTGETLAIVEAMKMENILRAERDQLVKKIHVKKGDSLAVDAVIMEFA